MIKVQPRVKKTVVKKETFKLPTKPVVVKKEIPSSSSKKTEVKKEPREAGTWPQGSVPLTPPRPLPSRPHNLRVGAGGAGGSGIACRTDWEQNVQENKWRKGEGGGGRSQQIWVKKEETEGEDAEVKAKKMPRWSVVKAKMVRGEDAEEKKVKAKMATKMPKMATMAKMSETPKMATIIECEEEEEDWAMKMAEIGEHEEMDEEGVLQKMLDDMKAKEDRYEEDYLMKVCEAVKNEEAADRRNEVKADTYPGLDAYYSSDEPDEEDGAMGPESWR